MNISEIVADAHETAKEKGWWDDERDPFHSIALMHSELSEAVEELRKKDCVWECMISASGKPEGVGVELADVIIRIADFCGAHDIDLEMCIAEKMDYNETRPYKHGKKA